MVEFGNEAFTESGVEKVMLPKGTERIGDTAHNRHILLIGLTTAIVHEFNGGVTEGTHLYLCKIFGNVYKFYATALKGT